jgi:exopolysaccharide biosynthesis polyprenyl glycosylphosphotransferase
MLRRYAAFIMFGRAVVDVCVITFVWLAVYYLRFSTGWFDISKGVPPFAHHLRLTLPVVAICLAGCLWGGLYRPQRTRHAWVQFVDVLKASVFGMVFLLAFFYYTEDVPYSRTLVTIFAGLLLLGLVASHLLSIVALRRLRRKGYNMRHYAVIGAGEKGQQLVRDIEESAWLGLKCAYFVENDESRIGTKVMGMEVLGPVEKLPELVAIREVDEVYLATSGHEAQRAYPALQTVQAMGVTVRIIPDWGQLASTRGVSATAIGSQVLFCAEDSPMSEGGVVIKEIFDRLVAAVMLAILSLPMLVIAIIIKATSRGPVLYTQPRVGMDGGEFAIFKFRTMRVDAEDISGPTWAKDGDPRRTGVGAWLRKTSLDELPQLFNVLKGDMSLVGPRPERPNFVKQFSEEYRRYMLRHKVKAGITGWAQINGLRGDTSLRKRLVYDLYYVSNWSFALDIWILLMTPWCVVKGRNAY